MKNIPSQLTTTKFPDPVSYLLTACHETCRTSHSDQQDGIIMKSCHAFTFQAMCATLSVGSMSNVSVFPEPRAASSKPSSMLSYYKSLPALDQHHDQLDRELQHLSDSVDVLYQQEDSEIEFLDSFIDYDDISLDNGRLTANHIKSKSTLGRPPIIPSENLHSSRRDKIRESLRWLAYKGKFSWKQFGSKDNLRSARGRRGAEGESKQKKVDLSLARSSSDLRHSRR